MVVSTLTGTGKPQISVNYEKYDLRNSPETFLPMTRFIRSHVQMKVPKDYCDDGNLFTDFQLT